MKIERNVMRRRGFTLVEVIIAAGLAAMVIGGAMYLYGQGHRFFHKVTEHATFRSEALIIQEKVAVDLEQLVVNKEVNPGTGNYYMIEPFQYLEPFTFEDRHPETGVVTPLKAGRGLRFYRFHHIDVGADAKPQMVAHKIEYTVVANPGPEGGKNLLRNGERVNQLPLEDAFFHSEPPIVVRDQMRGSPHAIVTLTVVPKGGALGSMEYRVISRLREEGSIVSRTYHLVGYESFYTAILYEAIRTGNRSGVHGAVYTDAYANNPDEAAAIAARIAGGASSAVVVPNDVFVIQTSFAFQDSTAATDDGWMAAPKAPGRDTGSGPWPAGEIPIGKTSSSSSSSG